MELSEKLTCFLDSIRKPFDTFCYDLYLDTVIILNATEQQKKHLFLNIMKRSGNSGIITEKTNDNFYDQLEVYVFMYNGSDKYECERSKDDMKKTFKFFSKMMKEFYTKLLIQKYI